MSVNYTQPHLVDVPVTDIDEAEDDLFVDTTRNAQNEFLESLDYEHEPPSYFKSIIGRVIQSLSSSTKRSSNYEMLPVGSSYRDDSDSHEDSENNPVFDFRDYKIDLLVKKVRLITVAGIAIITILVTCLLYLTHQMKIPGLGESISLKTIISNSTHEFHPTTIMVSLDGFHPHYINPHNTPTLHQMLLNDFGAPYMIPSFPSSTFPNHWTLVTGLYPSEHGIVGNTFYDPKLKKQFINTNPKVGGLDPDFWQAGEPLWTTAEKQGLRSAVHMWPGSEVPGVGPKDDFDRYNGSELLSSKVDRVMSWIDRDDITTRPELILTYVPTIDQIGHKVGIAGDELVHGLQYVDNFIELMLKELENRNLQDIANLIIVSDHGMAPTSNDRLLYLDDLIDMELIEHVDGWPLFGLRPYDSTRINEIYYELKAKLNGLDSDNKDHFSIFKREEIPKEWQFGGLLEDHKFNYRLAPIWIIPEVGFSVTTRKQMKENGNDYNPKGVHGYNNTELLMRAVFLGKGPYFRQRLAQGKKILPFQNTEVYNLVCDTLNLSPAANNGSDFTFNALVSNSNELPDDWVDPLNYPNLPFEVDHIVNDATYDLLWKKKKGAQPGPSTIYISTNDRPHQSLISHESFSTHISIHLPRPTDLVDPATSSDEVSAPGSSNMEEEIEEEMENVLDKISDVFGGLSDKVFNSMSHTVEGFSDWIEGVVHGENPS